MTSKPTVLNLRHDSIPADAIYVGRGRGSPWGNPFIIGKDGTRAEVIARYQTWLFQQPELIEQLPTLRGRDLVCFCAPLPCHADILLEAANSRPAFSTLGLPRNARQESRKSARIGAHSLKLQLPAHSTFHQGRR
jgi:Domain of unknown function (DUF4326)